MTLEVPARFCTLLMWNAGGGLTGLRFVGLNLGGLRMKRRRGRGLIGDLGLLWRDGWDWDRVGPGSFDGLRCGRCGCDGRRLGGEDIVGIGWRLGRQRQRADHAGLNGARGRVGVAPGLARSARTMPN